MIASAIISEHFLGTVIVQSTFARIIPPETPVRGTGNPATLTLLYPLWNFFMELPYDRESK